VSGLAGNGIGAEGAGKLAEPLGKLTALQTLDLGSAVLLFFCCVLRESRFVYPPLSPSFCFGFRFFFYVEVLFRQ
jgi:hypothetical protein